MEQNKESFEQKLAAERIKEDVEWYLFLGRLGIPHPRTWTVKKGFPRKPKGEVIKVK